MAILTIDEKKLKVLREAYQTLGGILETLEIMEDSEVREDIQAGLEDFKKGSTKGYKSLDEFLADVESPD